MVAHREASYSLCLKPCGPVTISAGADGCGEALRNGVNDLRRFRSCWRCLTRRDAPSQPGFVGLVGFRDGDGAGDGCRDGAGEVLQLKHCQRAL